MSDKACLTRAELELTQKLQLHFPGGGTIPKEILETWNGLEAGALREREQKFLNNMWRNEVFNKVIVLPPFISCGMTGHDWIIYLRANGHRLLGSVERILNSRDFQFSKIGSKVEIVILKGNILSDKDRTIENIQKEAESWGLVKPCIDVTCFTRMLLSRTDIEAMKLNSIITMHDPVCELPGANNSLSRLGLGISGALLDVFYCESSRKLGADDGFTFVKPVED